MRKFFPEDALLAVWLQFRLRVRVISTIPAVGHNLCHQIVHLQFVGIVALPIDGQGKIQKREKIEKRRK